MTRPLQIWTCAAFHPAFFCGGWACVRNGNGEVSGAAGGERRTTASRMALSGLAAALRGLPARSPATANGPIDIRTTSPDLALFGEVLASLGQKTPTSPLEADLDLWAQIMTASAGRRLSLTLTPLDPNTPLAFTTAWAELARDKAKASGPFAAAIPKSNLAKVAGLKAP
jgi:hypothetical protein